MQSRNGRYWDGADVICSDRVVVDWCEATDPFDTVEPRVT